ncbi:MAG: hypothetical protein KDI90_09580 [Alphaproteobacteria bacterium]|nr:hypothetical protein [Alphaproteobacteria bacterium]MCB9975679.1 hypothetical protein [Rhodospirillales bacterium]
MKQSTNHLLMIEPAEFYTNPETVETNAYQVDRDDRSRAEISRAAIREFRDYRDALVQNGVMVTTVLGHKGSPDMVFPNWASVYDDGRMVLYPMLSENRQKERRPDIIEMLMKTYPDLTDWSGYEKEGAFLESTASIVADHANRVGYAALSQRTHPGLVKQWGEFMGYDVVMFETESHAGIPVYHTDYLMYVGTEMAALCVECVLPEFRDEVLGRLKDTHDVMEISMDQLRANCGNALEVVGYEGARMLTMSEAARAALDEAQLKTIDKHYSALITSPLPTLEKYGGGSARCMLMELF